MSIKIKTEIIYNYLKENNFTVKQFCKKCGISQKTYNKLMNNELNIRIETYLKILNELKVYSEELLNTKD